MGKRFVVMLAGILAALAVVSAPARAADEEDAYARLLRRADLVNRELNQLIDSVDRPEPIPGYPERVLSIRKNASVSVGGEIRTNYVHGRGSHADASFAPSSSVAIPSGKVRTGDLRLSTVRLTIDARLRERWRAYFDINIDGYNGLKPIDGFRNPNTPGGVPVRDYDREKRSETVGEAYVELLKAGHSGFGFRAGLIKLPFGLANRPDLVGRSFLDAPDLDASYLMDIASGGAGVRLPHASRLQDPAVALMLNYEMRDIVRFEAGLFQDRDGDRVHSYASGGTRKYRTDSPLPLSWQAGFSLLPLEGWELSATFRNRHSRSGGVRSWSDSPYRWDFLNNLASGKTNPTWDSALGQWSDTGGGTGFGARTNEQALAVGLAVEIPNTALAVQLEYAHGWNQGFNKYINSDDVSLGLSYRPTPFLTLHGQGEWLLVRDKSWMAGSAAAGWGRDSRNNRLYRLLLGAEYELFRGLTIEGGWQYEYWNATSSLGADGTGRQERVSTANIFFVGTRFIF